LHFYIDGSKMLHDDLLRRDIWESEYDAFTAANRA
jgi:hypothetical protein